MRTSLKYGVSRDDKIDHTTGKETRAIKFRGFTFCVSGAESKSPDSMVCFISSLLLF